MKTSLKSNGFTYVITLNELQNLEYKESLSFLIKKLFIGKNGERQASFNDLSSTSLAAHEEAFQALRTELATNGWLNHCGLSRKNLKHYFYSNKTLSVRLSRLMQQLNNFNAATMC